MGLESEYRYRYRRMEKANAYPLALSLAESADRGIGSFGVVCTQILNKRYSGNGWENKKAKENAKPTDITFSLRKPRDAFNRRG